MTATSRLPLVAYFSMEYGLHEEFHSSAYAKRGQS